MENLAEILASASTLTAGWLVWKVRDMDVEIKSLRQSRHSHGNFITGLQGDVRDIERRLDKMGNGDK